MRVDAARATYVQQLEPGRRLVFCSQRCLDRFNASPADFAGAVETAPLPPA
jgi:YHS domain-containing protein